MVVLALLAPIATIDCGGSDAPPTSGPSADAGGNQPPSGTNDSGVTDGGAPGPSDGGFSLRSCPTTGKGAITAGAGCVVFTPQEAGAASAGANADADSYALEPTGAAKGALVIHLNGSLVTPAGNIFDPAKNLYNAAASSGFHVLALAYDSTTIIGSICKNNAACFGPTRQSIILGKVAPGTPASFSGIREDEGIVPRIAAALRLLAAAKPSAGWAAFLDDPTNADLAKRIAWSKVIVSGHSQGGGHAAYMGKLFPLRRVVQLASTCDATDDGTPAPWTGAATAWATSPNTAFVGFAAPTTFGPGGNPITGDLTCPHHLAVWKNMNLDPSRMHDDADTCGGGNAHGASIGCTTNYDRWRTLFE